MAINALYESFKELDILVFMKTHNKIKDVSQYIKNLCAGKSEDELQEAEINFRSYLNVVKQIIGRLQREGKNVKDFDEKL